MGINPTPEKTGWAVPIDWLEAQVVFHRQRGAEEMIITVEDENGEKVGDKLYIWAFFMGAGGPYLYSTTEGWVDDFPPIPLG